jgi:hypothetical protein
MQKVEDFNGFINKMVLFARPEWDDGVACRQGHHPDQLIGELA